MPPQVKRTDSGTGPLIELEEVSEEIPVGLSSETDPVGSPADGDFLGEEVDENLLGEEVPQDQWRKDEAGNIIIDPAPEDDDLLGEELTFEGSPKYKDGIYTLEGFKEWEQQEKEEGRNGFWHWATKTLPEASKEAFSYLYEGGKQIPDKFKEDPLKATAIFPEAALSAAEGWVDIATGAADLAQRPFRAADENQKARYERYKMFAGRTKRILEDRKSRVGDAIRSAGYLLDKDFNEYAAKYDEGINPASADTLGIVLDPGALFGGSIYRTVGRVAGKPSIAANKALNNVIKGINQGTTKKIFDVAKETLKRPATQTAKGAGTLVDYAGKGVEKIGQGISNLGQEGRLLEKFPQAAKNIGEVVKILNLKSKNTQKIPTHTIRYWEKEFKQVRPKILSGNRRYYDKSCIDLLRKIKYLLKDQGMTINGVKKVLNSNIPNELDEISNKSIRSINLKNKIINISKIIKTIKNLK